VNKCEAQTCWNLYSTAMSLAAGNQSANDRLESHNHWQATCGDEADSMESPNPQAKEMPGLARIVAGLTVEGNGDNARNIMKIVSTDEPLDDDDVEEQKVIESDFVPVVTTEAMVAPDEPTVDQEEEVLIEEDLVSNVIDFIPIQEVKTPTRKLVEVITLGPKQGTCASYFNANAREGLSCGLIESSKDCQEASAMLNLDKKITDLNNPQGFYASVLCDGV